MASLDDLRKREVSFYYQPKTSLFFITPYNSHLNRLKKRRKRRKRINSSREALIIEGMLLKMCVDSCFYRCCRGGSGLAVQAPGSGAPRGPANNDHNLLHRIVERGMNDARDMGTGNVSGEGVQTIEITLYRNGFTVNNGPFREITQPENQRFLHSLQRGEVPEGEYYYS